MAFNGSGTFSLVAGNPVVTGTTISSTWCNNTLSDIATNGLTNCIVKDGQTTITANLPMGGFIHTGVGSGSSANHYPAISQVQNASFNWLTSVSGTNTITGVATPTPTAYAEGQTFGFIPAVSNTGNATLNVSSIGALPIFLNGSTATTSVLKARIPVAVAYVSTASSTGFHITGHGGFIPYDIATALLTVNTPPGVIQEYAGTAVPSGWLECDGTAISRTTYSSLFTVLGTTWGVGDASTTFNVPDLRGKTTIGAGTGTVIEIVGSTASVSTASNCLLVTSNFDKWITGMEVVLTTTGGAPTGLTAGNTYYVVRESTTKVRLASSLALAQAGTAVDITGPGTGHQTITYTMSARTIGEIGGEQSHAMSSSELLAHTHTAQSQTGAAFGQPSGGVPNSAAETGSAGGNAAMNIMQPYAVTMIIIKT